MDDLINKKIKYNELLKRESDAVKYLNNCSEDNFKRYLPNYQEIVRELSLLGLKLNATDDEALYGFIVDRR